MKQSKPKKSGKRKPQQMPLANAAVDPVGYPPDLMPPAPMMPPPSRKPGRVPPASLRGKKPQPKKG